MKKGNNNSRALWKEFLTGVLATAIGVGLSFAVNNMVENHKKDQARRHTAMMAIYDIDEIARQIREARHREEQSYKVATYMHTHRDELDSLSIDSLRVALTYLAEDKSESFDWADDSKEKAFNSSMDAWQNLQNTQFYDNVLSCYRLRSELLRMMEYEIIFKRPVSDSDLNQFYMQLDDSGLDYSGGLNQKALVRLLRQVLQQPLTTRYFRTFFLRNAVLSDCADKLVSLNQENKVLMDITDKDIEDYIRTNVSKTRPATAKKLLGEWECNQDEDRTELFLFKPDNTVSLTSHAPFSVSFYLAEEDMTILLNCPISYRIEGGWELVRDSLRMKFNPETCELLSLDVDINSMPKSAVDRERDSLEVRKQELKDYVLSFIRQSDWDINNKVSLDLTGRILFLTAERSTLLGGTETEQQQMIKKSTKKY
ncbi:MAG: hypothetical protein J5737_07435 [Bacteroidales bacterium]|nr:hypothetical protein [Bacteroidales bacterium]